MNDDFNTPEAVAVLFEMANEINKSKSVETARLLKSLAGVLGLLQREANDFLQGRAMPFMPSQDMFVVARGRPNNISAMPAVSGTPLPLLDAASFSKERIEQLIEDRATARKAKNFAEGDRIRKELLDAGIVLEDHPNSPTTWRRS
jgi:cysteinyl-tRNA synthetase